MFDYSMPYFKRKNNLRINRTRNGNDNYRNYNFRYQDKYSGGFDGPSDLRRGRKKDARVLCKRTIRYCLVAIENFSAYGFDAYGCDFMQGVVLLPSYVVSRTGFEYLLPAALFE